MTIESADASFRRNASCMGLFAVVFAQRDLRSPRYTQLNMQQVPEQPQGAGPTSSAAPAAPVDRGGPSHEAHQHQQCAETAAAPKFPPAQSGGGGGGGSTGAGSSGGSAQGQSESSSPAAAPACCSGQGCGSSGAAEACAPQEGHTLAGSSSPTPAAAAAAEPPIEVASPVCFAGQFTEYTGVSPH